MAIGKTTFMFRHIIKTALLEHAYGAKILCLTTDMKSAARLLQSFLIYARDNFPEVKTFWLNSTEVKVNESIVEFRSLAFNKNAHENYLDVFKDNQLEDKEFVIPEGQESFYKRFVKGDWVEGET